MHNYSKQLCGGMLAAVLGACALEVEDPTSPALAAGALNTLPIVRDSHFGNQGAVFLPPAPEAAGFANAVVIRDGQTVIAGQSGVTGGVSPSSFLVARFAADGNLDTGFGSGGKVIGLFPSQNSEATALATQSDGKLIVAGHAFDPSGTHCYAVTRLGPNGAVDNDFGTLGSVRKCFPSDGGQVRAIAVQDDGKIVLAGFARTTNLDSVRAGLVRLTTSGAFDTSFDGDGVAQLGTAGLIASAIGIQSDGKIIAAGVANNRFAIERYATDGSLDRTFAGRAGVRFVPFVTPAGTVPSPNLPLSSEAFSLSVDAEDRIVVAGHAYTRIAGRDYHFGALARLAPAGDLDETFGDRGLIVTAVGTAPGNYAAFRSVSTRSNGSLVVAGEYETTTRAFKVALAQYDATGELQGQILDSFSPAGLVLRPHALVLSRAPTLVQVYATVVGNGSARIEGASGMRSGAGLMRYVLGAPLSIPSPPITPIQLPGRPAFPEQIR